MKLYHNLYLIAIALFLTTIEASQSRSILIDRYSNLLSDFLLSKEIKNPGFSGSIQPDKLTGKPKNQSINCQPTHTEPNFLVVGGGGAPSYNEIALEKNILYFQRTLKQMGYQPSLATIFFANGNDKQATVRYLDNQRNEKFKVPHIPNLQGSATVKNFQQSLKTILEKPEKKPLFFYFTGHGYLNKANDDNNAIVLWKEELVSVRRLSNLLDQLPQDKPIVAMMAQCFSGSFSNFIYQDGLPGKPLSLQTRCGFFATISSLPSVGCTPEVNEADYQDYSSSFFAGLSGVNRVGKTVPSADYNRDGRVSYAEAHAFAKVDEKSPDLPVSTSEVWLQRKITETDFDRILNEPIVNFMNIARPEQKYVLTSLAELLQFNPKDSYLRNFEKILVGQPTTQVAEAYQLRLIMQLVNIGIEQKIRLQKNHQDLAILNRLIDCEASSWK
jgi:hypothetical protein